jgi:hypothetical protein
MISSEHLSKRIDEFLNKSGTNDNFKISTPAKVRAINSSQLILIKRKIGMNNIYKKGFESFRKRFDDLDFLIKDAVEVPLFSSNGMLYADTSGLEDYMFYIKSYCFADKGTCTNRRLRNYLVKRADLENYIKSDTHMPSFDWQEQLVTMADNKIQIYTASDYTVNKLYLDYIRQPKQVDIKGYKKDGVDSQTVDCEFPEHLEDELLDIIVEQLAMTITDQAQIQFSQSRQQRNE